MAAGAAVVALALGAGPVMGQPAGTTAAEKEDAGPALLVLRAGRLWTSRLDLSGGIEVAVQLQPLRGREAPWRNLAIGARLALDPFGDFSGFERAGVELGYVIAAPRVLGPLGVGAAVTGTLDHWDIHRDDSEAEQGRGLGVGVGLRPWVRLWRVEISVGAEVGRTFAVDRSYVNIAAHLGVALF